MRSTERFHFRKHKKWGTKVPLNCVEFTKHMLLVLPPRDMQIITRKGLRFTLYCNPTLFFRRGTIKAHQIRHCSWFDSFLLYVVKRSLNRRWRNHNNNRCILKNGLESRIININTLMKQVQLYKTVDNVENSYI